MITLLRHTPAEPFMPLSVGPWVLRGHSARGLHSPSHDDALRRCTAERTVELALRSYACIFGRRDHNGMRELDLHPSRKENQRY